MHNPLWSCSWLDLEEHCTAPQTSQQNSTAKRHFLLPLGQPQPPPCHFLETPLRMACSPSKHLLLPGYLRLKGPSLGCFCCQCAGDNEPVTVLRTRCCLSKATDSTDQVLPDVHQAAPDVVPGHAAEHQLQVCPAKEDATVQEGQFASLQRKRNCCWGGQRPHTHPSKALLDALCCLAGLPSPATFWLGTV